MKDKVITTMDNNNMDLSMPLSSGLFAVLRVTCVCEHSSLCQGNRETDQRRVDMHEKRESQSMCRCARSKVSIGARNDGLLSGCRCKDAIDDGHMDLGSEKDVVERKLGTPRRTRMESDGLEDNKNKANKTTCKPGNRRPPVPKSRPGRPLKSSVQWPKTRCLPLKGDCHMGCDAIVHREPDRKQAV